MGAAGGSISGITVFLVAAGICYCYCKKKCCWADSSSSAVAVSQATAVNNTIVNVPSAPPPAQPIIMPMPMMYQNTYPNMYGQPMPQMHQMPQMPQMHQMPQYQNDNIYQPQRNPRDTFNATQ